jgi:hypothetical protein
MASERGRWGETVVQALEEAVEWTRGERNDLLVVRYYRRDDGMVVREESRGGTVLREEVLPADSLPETIDSGGHVEGPPAYFGFQIADIRTKLGLSRDLFARLLGSSVSSVSAWEQGRREPPGSARRLLQIADADPDLVLRILFEPVEDVSGARPPRAVAARVDVARLPRAAADTQGR